MCAGLCAEALLLNLLGLPQNLSLDAFAFADQGANLTANRLLSMGLRPLADFGYPYGLLTLLLGRLWFAVLGQTPWAYQLAMLAVDLIVASALAKLAVRLHLGLRGAALIVSGLPFALMTSYWCFSQAFEAALLSTALTEQAGAKRGSALAITTAALFVKPSMAYVYGALLLVFVILDSWREKPGARRIISMLAPAAATFIVLSAALCAVYGVNAVVGSLLPRGAVRGYGIMNYGFFRLGRSFYYFPGVRPGYYVGTSAGFFLIATVFLFAAGVRALYRMTKEWRQGASFRITEELILSCAVMHAVFIFLMFGNAPSWTYYSYLIVIGMAILSGPGYATSRVWWILALIALVGNRTSMAGEYRAWKTTRPTEATAGLWSSSEEAMEWSTVRRMARGQKAMFISWGGCAPILAPEFVQPPSAFMLPGLALRREIAAEAAQVAEAGCLVTPAEHGFAAWPFRFLATAVGRRELLWKGKYFEVFGRNLQEK